MLHLWEIITAESLELIAEEPALKILVEKSILKFSSVSESLSSILANKFANSAMSSDDYFTLFVEIEKKNKQLKKSFEADLIAVKERDPACVSYMTSLLFFKGYLAIQASRFSHALWLNDRKAMAYHLQSRNAEIFNVDIHPAAKIGKGILLDHATSFVAGETAVIGDNVSLLHEVTLGGSGKHAGDRHPKIDDGLLIGAGAKLLGNIKVGKGAKIGASSVVLADVQPHTTVVGIPAVPVGVPGHDNPSEFMEHFFQAQGI